MSKIQNIKCHLTLTWCCVTPNSPTVWGCCQKEYCAIENKKIKISFQTYISLILFEAHYNWLFHLPRTLSTTDTDMYAKITSSDQKLEQNFHCTSAHILTISCLATCGQPAFFRGRFLSLSVPLSKEKVFLLFTYSKCHVHLMDVSEITFEDTAAQLKISWKFE